MTRLSIVPINWLSSYFGVIDTGELRHQAEQMNSPEYDNACVIVILNDLK